MKLTAKRIAIEKHLEYQRVSVDLAEYVGGEEPPDAHGRTFFTITVTGPAETFERPLPEQLAEFERLARSVVSLDALRAWSDQVRQQRLRS